MRIDDDSDIFYIKKIMHITIRNPEVFEGRFTPDRYGNQANKKLHEYGKSLYKTNVIFKNKEYKVLGYSVMHGSCGYVGSLVIIVEETK